jgi:hypothetical protein
MTKTSGMPLAQAAYPHEGLGLLRHLIWPQTFWLDPSTLVLAREDART